MGERQWSEDEERILAHEAFITEVIRRRKENDPNAVPRQSLLRFLESTTGTALITILLGSLLAPIVISHIQTSRTRDDQALAEYKLYLTHQQEVVTDTYDLVGRMIYSAQDLITLTKPTFDMTRIDKEDKETIEKQKREMIGKYNSTIKEWRIKENMQGLIISYYFYGAQEVQKSWGATQKAVDDFVKCAQDRHEEFLNHPEISSQPDKCSIYKEPVKISLSELAHSIEISRRYTWQQLEVPTPQPVRPSASPLLTPKLEKSPG